MLLGKRENYATINEAPQAGASSVSEEAKCQMYGNSMQQALVVVFIVDATIRAVGAKKPSNGHIIIEGDYSKPGPFSRAAMALYWSVQGRS